MPGLKNRFKTLNISHLQVAGIILLIVLASLLICVNNINSNSPQSPLMAQIEFQGEYRIGDGEWQKYIDGQHIPATKGDVTLRGQFHQFAPDGEYAGVFSGDLPLAFYTDHINLMIYEGENDPYTIDIENPLFGNTLCGAGWTAYTFTGDSAQTVEIVVRNPHRFGNETAVDELLSNLSIWGGLEFKNEILAEGNNQRNMGLMVIICSLLFLGAALFSILLHIKNSRVIWLVGSSFLFAGIYLEYSAAGLFFWKENTFSNTNILGISMIFYMFFICSVITYCLHKTKKIGEVTVFVLGTVDGLCFMLPLLLNISIYDTLPFWVIAQTGVNAVLLCCLIKEIFDISNRDFRWIYFLLGLPLIAFVLDVLSAKFCWWKEGFVSKNVFVFLFIAALFMILKIIPQNINAVAKARELELQRVRLEAEKKELEAELKDSRVSIMLSQIQPHFIYNTLGTIERLCLKDPQKAFEIVRNFSLYLRGNFSELDSVTPIRFAEELKHVEYYVNIEKVRFPDMNIEYQVEATDFVLPALSVQPLVENAIKHGLMRLETGGTVVIHSYETPTHFCVEVKDNGVGFDTTLLVDGKEHVGLRNIRGRLKAMLNGELIVESRQNAGTRAVIMIPKEVVK